MCTCEGVRVCTRVCVHTGARGAVTSQLAHARPLLLPQGSDEIRYGDWAECYPSVLFSIKCRYFQATVHGM